MFKTTTVKKAVAKAMVWGQKKVIHSMQVLNNEKGGAEKGSSTLIWIFVGVLAAVVIWGLLSGWIQTFWTSITNKIGTIQ